MPGRFSSLIVALVLLCAAQPAFCATLELDALIDEATHNSPTVLAADARLRAAERRVPQAGALSDPMFMLGYQDEDNGRFNYGKSPDAQAMVGVSQMFPYPGKLGIKEAMAMADVEAVRAVADEARLRAAERVRELYVEIYAAERAYAELAALEDLYARIEDAALARYASGMGMQQEALMAQNEKYMLRERKTMLRERADTARAMLGQALGRGAMTPVTDDTLAPPPMLDIAGAAEQYITMHLDHAPMVRERQYMVDAAQKRIDMARREYFPDITVDAKYSFRGEPYNGMWSLTGTVNLPVWRKGRLDPALDEAQAALEAAKAELEATRLMLASSIREGLVMVRSAESLMSLYHDTLKPKARQGFDAALSAYSTGRGSASDAISSLRSLVDSEVQYWQQYAARQKAAVKIQASAGMMSKAKEAEGK